LAAAVAGGVAGLRRPDSNGVSRPHACLNPLMTVGQSIAGPLFIHTSWFMAQLEAKKSQVLDMLNGWV
jgi:peptide/nickel transport system ATP-binding protein